MFDDEHPDGAPTKAKELTVEPCKWSHATALVRRWHSRLPVIQDGPWVVTFRAHWHDYTYGVALWNNPSARNLPNDWLELRRMAVAPDAPRFTATRMLGQMARWIQANRPNCPRLISYQDADVHTGTIYKAANWHRTHFSAPRIRGRGAYARDGVTVSKGVRRAINGEAPDTAGKWRWELEL